MEVALGSLFITDEFIFTADSERFFVFSPEIRKTDGLDGLLGYVFGKRPVVFLQPEIEGIERELPFFREEFFSRLYSPELKTLRILSMAVFPFIPEGEVEYLDVDTFVNTYSLVYKTALREVSQRKRGSFLELVLHGRRKRFPLSVLEGLPENFKTPDASLERYLIKKGEIPLVVPKTSTSIPRRGPLRKNGLAEKGLLEDEPERKIAEIWNRLESEDFEIEDVGEEEERDFLEEAKVNLFKSFFTWLSEKTLTPAVLFVSLKEGEKELLPSVLYSFKISPNTFDYYSLVDKVQRGVKLEGEERRESSFSGLLGKKFEKKNEELRKLLLSYFKRKERWPSIRLKKDGEREILGIKEVVEENFRKFLENGDLKALKTASAGSSFLKEVNPKLLSYVREIFSVEDFEEFPMRFLTSSKEAEEVLRTKADDFFESFYPGVEFPEVDGQKLLSLPYKESLPYPNVFYWFLNSIDLSKVDKDVRRFLETLLYELEAKDDPLYSFNFIT